MRIAIVTSNYPYPARPYCGAFVRELVWEFARQGHECTVVAPSVAWDRVRFGALGRRRESEQVSGSNATVEVRRPRILTASAVRVAGLNSLDLSDHLFYRAVRKEIAGLRGTIDVLYGHFFYPGGLAAARCSDLFGLPYFVAHGDHEVTTWYFKKGAKDFRRVAGVVAVSSDLAAFGREVFEVPEAKVEVFPNGVDRRLFFRRDRLEARRRLGLPLGAKLVAFVGRFVDGKGPDRVVAAVEGLENTYCLLMGEGPNTVKSSRVVFSGVVTRDLLPWYLSAADVFALPTTGEGCSNAILEALACGLPIVSSVGSFNDDILNDDVAIRVPPMDVAAIRRGISAWLDDPNKRQRAERACEKWSKSFSIERRAKGIARWIGDRLRAGEAGRQDGAEASMATAGGTAELGSSPRSRCKGEPSR